MQQPSQPQIPAPLFEGFRAVNLKYSAEHGVRMMSLGANRGQIFGGVTQAAECKIEPPFKKCSGKPPLYGCECGFYALQSFDDIAAARFAGAALVDRPSQMRARHILPRLRAYPFPMPNYERVIPFIAKVVLSGVVSECSEGWRGTHQTVLALDVIERCLEGPLSRVEGCESPSSAVAIKLFNGENWLYPTCDQHRSASPTFDDLSVSFGVPVGHQTAGRSRLPQSAAVS